MTLWPFKVVVVGDDVDLDIGCSTKTHLLHSFTGRGAESFLPAVFDNFSTEMEVDGTVVTIGLFDTVASENYDRCRPLSYPMTDVFILCFSFTSPVSLDNVRKLWYPELKHHCPDTPIILVGTEMEKKEDPETIDRLKRAGLTPILSSQGREMQRKIRAERYFECSSSRGEGVYTVFLEAARVALQHSRPTEKSQRKKCTVQ